MTAPRSGLVAVLFTDLVGSTELMSQLGDRAFDDLRRRHFAALAKAVAAHGGEEVKNTGDGLMAVFPSAAEAVEAAVAMQQATARQAKSGPLAIRAGVAVGDATFEGGDYFGTPVVEAARLVAAARPGQILATAVVRMLAGSRCTATFTDQGPLQLKGLPEPVAVWQVDWQPLGSSVPMPSLLTDVGRIFVGREAEQERLRQLWKEAVAGERRVALLAGEPGVGKTRLAAELAVAVHEQGALVLAGRCDEDLGVPYQPFVEALRHFVDHALVEDLREHLGRYGGELARLLPEVTERLPDLPSPLSSDPETERYRLFDAVAAWLAAVSAENPVLLVLDDLQWAAKPTLLLLRHVVRSGETMRVLVVGTYRDTELAHDHPLLEVVADLRRHVGVDRMALAGLDDVAVAAFVEQTAGRELDDDAVALARAIYDETQGNPFFLKEILRHLAETGAVVRQEGRWTTHLPIEELGIPESVRDVVGRRLTHLSKDANRLLHVAAVVGAEFDLDVLRTADVLEDDDLVAALEEATSARLVVEAPGTAPRYRFAHALVRDTLYQGLSAARRTTLHRRVAEAIEVVHGPYLDDHLPALAHHWARAAAPAAETGRAVDYARRAGDRALAQLAHDEAVAYYRQALELREVAGAPADRQQCELMIAFGEAQRRTGDPVHRETLLQAGSLARELGDVDLLSRAALSNRRGLFSRLGAVDEERVAALQVALDAIGPSDSRERAQLLAALASELHFADDDRRVELGRQGLAVARRLGDIPTLAEALVALWLAIWDPNAAGERVVLAGELADLAGRMGDPVLEFHAGLARFLTGSEQGDMAAADEGLATCVRIGDELGQPMLRWRAAYLQAHRALVDGRFDDVERRAQEAVHWGEIAGQPDADALSLASLFYLRMLQGRFDEAMAIMRPLAERFSGAAVYPLALAWACAAAGAAEEARAIVLGVGGASLGALRREYVWLATLVELSRTCVGLGDASAAEELYDLLRPYHSAIAIGQVVWFGPVAYDLGRLATTLGRYTEADAHFAEAVEIHARIGVRGMLAHTYLEWGRTLLRRSQTGDTERARELLGQALATGRELGLGGVEREAVALIGALP